MSDNYIKGGAWRCISATALPAQLAGWLLDPGSLTAKLKALHPSFDVHILSHRPAAPRDDEAALLAMPFAYQEREVLLYSNAVPLVYARSLIPEEGLSGSLNGIGNQPLGEVLFSRDDVRCGPLAVCHFGPDSEVAALNERLLGTRRDLWGRRRLFTLAGQTVLVAEVFLSAAPCYEEPQ